MKQRNAFLIPIKTQRAFWFALLLFFSSTSCFANELDSLIKNNYGRIKTQLLNSTDEIRTANELTNPNYDSHFIPLPIRKTLSPQKSYWYKLDFDGIDLSNSQEWIIRFPKYDKINLYLAQDSSLSKTIGGRLHRKNTNGSPHAVDFIVDKRDLIQGHYLLAEIQHIFRKSYFQSPTYLHPLVAALDSTYYTLDDILNYTPYLLFIGGMFLMILYSLGIYFMNRDKLFNYYALYLLALVLYLGVRMPLLFGALEMRFPQLMHIYNELIQVLVNIFYLLFASVFMNTRQDFPKLHTAIRYAIRFLSGIMVLQLLFILSGTWAWVEQYLVQFERYFMIVFTLTAYIYILRVFKNQMIYFLVIGSFFFLVGAMLAMYLHHIKYMMLGAAIEVFIFSLGMGYRIKQVEYAKQSIENEINKIRLTALRAQMNPHFIFNSLNSIRAYIISSETKKASDYLNKFAQLIRLILHYSSKDTIALKDELDALALYVELEQLRYRDYFDFEIKIDPAIDQKSWQVPPLILQPYVENAIGHGLAPKQGSKKLIVEVGKSGSKLSFTIMDNGVGRNFSKDLRNRLNPKHKSVAMELTRKRINLAQEKHNGKESITITDLVEKGQSTGTKVAFYLSMHTG